MPARRSPRRRAPSTPTRSTRSRTFRSSTYPEFADLLTALKSGAIDGYIAEEPTAFSVCGSNDDTDLPAVQEQRHRLYRNGGGCRHRHRPEEGQRRCATRSTPFSPRSPPSSAVAAHGADRDAQLPAAQ
ncbi:MAG: hypothetical protein ACLUNO_06530 [Oscillospiraceae bacterium]